MAVTEEHWRTALQLRRDKKESNRWALFDNKVVVLIGDAHGTGDYLSSV